MARERADLHRDGVGRLSTVQLTDRGKQERAAAQAEHIESRGEGDDFPVGDAELLHDDGSGRYEDGRARGPVNGGGKGCRTVAKRAKRAKGQPASRFPVLCTLQISTDSREESSHCDYESILPPLRIGPTTRMLRRRFPTRFAGRGARRRRQRRRGRGQLLLTLQ